VSRIDVNFSAGTISVNGGAAAPIGTTVTSFTAALNTALGSNGSASFAGGKLSIAATGSNGILVQDNASSPSRRGGEGFSQFFGLNDIFQSQAPSVLTTGLSASDASGPGGGRQDFAFAQGAGRRHRARRVITTTAGQTIGDVVSALNTAMAGRPPSRSIRTVRSAPARRRCIRAMRLT
jgi:flagellar hook-associated protein 1 FlgK